MQHGLSAQTLQKIRDVFVRYPTEIKQNSFLTTEKTERNPIV